jgi:hypothetical protein
LSDPLPVPRQRGLPERQPDDRNVIECSRLSIWRMGWIYPMPERTSREVWTEKRFGWELGEFT